jgi:hypothetical protein
MMFEQAGAKQCFEKKLMLVTPSEDLRQRTCCIQLEGHDALLGLHLACLKQCGAVATHCMLWHWDAWECCAMRLVLWLR